MQTIALDQLSTIAAAFVGSHAATAVTRPLSLAELSRDELWSAINSSIDSYHAGQAIPAQEVKTYWEQKLGHVI